MRTEFHGLLVLETGELLVVDCQVALFTSHAAASGYYPLSRPECIVVLVTVASAVSQVRIQEVV